MRSMVSSTLALIGCALLLSPLWSGGTGVIRGDVVVPKGLDTSSAPIESKLYVYLVDVRKWDKKNVPWPPIGPVKDFPIRSIKGPKVAFEFRNVPPSTYQVHVFIDTGRPHVRPGSKSFIAYPGDYVSLKDPEVSIKPGEEKEVTLSYGTRIAVPEGYSSPKFLPDP